MLKKLWKIIYRSTLTLGLLGLVYYLVLQPMKVVGQDPIDPFKVDQQIFSERVSYLFREPKVGDAVTFISKTVADLGMGSNSMPYFGIITKINNENNIKTYQIISTKSQKVPWEVSRDKIITHIYYPAISKNSK